MSRTRLRQNRIFMNNVSQIVEANKGSKFAEEIKEEQEEKKKAEEEKKSRQQQFKERAALFGGES